MNLNNPSHCERVSIPSTGLRAGLSLPKGTSAAIRLELTDCFALLAMTALLAFASTLSAQVTLTRDQAIQLTLEHNYGIQVAQKNIESAKNNSSIYNSAYLPTVSTVTSGQFTFNAGENQTVQGDFSFDPAEAYGYNASIGIDYVIFNGFGRMYNYRQLKEEHQLTELQARQIIENTLVQLSDTYHEVAMLSEQIGVLEQALRISETRLKRTEYAFEYGQGTRLEMLNADVDLNNDSINLLNAIQRYDNAKRNLNLIMGRALDTGLQVDTSVTFSMALNHEECVAKALERNAMIQQTNSQLRNSEYAIKASRAGWFPSLSASAGYAYQGQNNPNGAFLTGSESYGPQAGLSLSWNIFDGGITKTRMQSAKIALETQKIRREETTRSVQRDVQNAYAAYRNALFVLETQRRHLTTAQKNFDRSHELHRQGQITSIEFRQAQLNLSNAQSRLSESKYAAKNAELVVKQLAGVLLEE